MSLLPADVQELLHGAGLGGVEYSCIRGGAVEDFAVDLTKVAPPLRGCLPAELLCVGDGVVRLNAAGGHALTALPEAIAVRWPRLRVAFFLGNRFEGIPAVLGSCHALFMLSFKSNRVSAIPEGALGPTLGWLILTGSNARVAWRCPHWVCVCAITRCGHGADNAIARLPESLGTLRYLRKLMLASNQLGSLPVSGCGLLSEQSRRACLTRRN